MTQEISFDALYFTCYIIERTARGLKQRNRYVVNTIGRGELERLLEYADVLHCENPDSVTADLVSGCGLTRGSYDITRVDPALVDEIPTPLRIGKVYARLIRDTKHGGESWAEAVERIYNSELCEVLDNYNCSAYYEPSYYIARAYFEGGFH